MTLVFYNTLTRKKEAFRPIEAGVVRMYNCGPTVYGRQHIGNFRAFLFADLLRRWLEYRGLRVLQVMNITDVGHLVGDEEQGEDKIEAQAARDRKDPFEISRHYCELFLQDVRALGVKEPMARPRATEYIDAMVAMVVELIERGHAYQVGGDVYFDVQSFPPYGRLSGNKVEELEAGARIAVHADKRHPADFALWKSDPKHLMKWSTCFGPDGFPGWHIECSAMARALLGDRLDIHTGGEDNIFPHHECEIAQSESLSGRPFANYWMHTKFLQVDGGKMSKSLGNVYTLDDIRARGFSMRALRFTLIRGHYRTPLNFTWEILKAQTSALANLDDLVQRLQRHLQEDDGGSNPQAGQEAVAAAKAAFEQAMDDDLNVPEALVPLFGLRDRVLAQEFGSAAARAGLDFLGAANEVLGVLELEQQAGDAEIDALIAAREEARARRNWSESDRLRDVLLARGIELQDTARGTEWRRQTK